MEKVTEIMKTKRGNPMDRKKIPCPLEKNKAGRIPA
jgi:hypothetical protein